MAYISAVYEDILKIPFFPENYMNLWIFLIKYFFLVICENFEKNWKNLIFDHIFEKKFLYWQLKGPRYWTRSTKPLMMIFYVKTQIFENIFFPSCPQPRQGRWIQDKMAYISAVYEDILKIPFFPENYMNLWIFLIK